MKNIFMTIGVASSLLASPAKQDGTLVYKSNQTINMEKQWLLSETLNTVQDLKGYVTEDYYNNRINHQVMNNYLYFLNNIEDNLIEIYNANTNY